MMTVCTIPVTSIVPSNALHDHKVKLPKNIPLENSLIPVEARIRPLDSKLGKHSPSFSQRRPISLQQASLESPRQKTFPRNVIQQQQEQQRRAVEDDGSLFELTIIVVPDRRPEEISWTVANAETDRPLASGGATARDTRNPTGLSMLIPAGEYWFELTDEGENGICCRHGDGYYRLMVDDRVVGEGYEYESTSGRIYFDIQAPSRPPTDIPTQVPTDSPSTAVRTTQSPTVQPVRNSPTVVVTIPVLTVGFLLSPTSIVLEEDESNLLRQLLTNYVQDMLTSGDASIIVDLSSVVSFSLQGRNGIVGITGTWVGPESFAPSVESLIQSFSFWGVNDFYQIFEEEMGLELETLSVQVNRTTVQPAQDTGPRADSSEQQQQDGDDGNKKSTAVALILGLVSLTLALGIFIIVFQRFVRKENNKKQQQHRRQATVSDSTRIDTEESPTLPRDETERAIVLYEGSNPTHRYEFLNYTEERMPPFASNKSIAGMHRITNDPPAMEVSTPLAQASFSSMNDGSSAFDVNSHVSQPSSVEVSVDTGMYMDERTDDEAHESDCEPRKRVRTQFTPIQSPALELETEQAPTKQAKVELYEPGKLKWNEDVT